MEEVVNLQISELAPNPLRPRSSIPHDSLLKLADSIRRYGVLVPLVVASTPVGYQIICGERRWRAAKLAGLSEVPAVVKSVQPQEMLILALMDNVQQEKLTVFEQAGAIQTLQNRFGMSLQEIGENLGLGVEEIRLRLKLLDFSDKLKKEILARRMSDREALEIARQKNEQEAYQEAVKKSRYTF